MAYDYCVSAAHSGYHGFDDLRRGEWVAGVLEQAGGSVCRLWLHADGERRRLAREAPAMVMLAGDEYSLNFPPEFAAFRVEEVASRKKLILVFLENQGVFGGYASTPDTEVELIDLTGYASLALKRAALLAALGLGQASALPLLLQAQGGNPRAPWSDTCCPHCGTGNRGVARYCCGCGAPQVEPLPVMPSGTPEPVLGPDQPCPMCKSASAFHAAHCIRCGDALPPQVGVGVPAGQPLSPMGRGSATGMLPAQTLLKRRFLLKRRLGRGGMGAVYLAEDLDFGRRLVAVKEMGRGDLDPQELQKAAESFKREALLLAGLRHPCLPSVYDHFADRGRWYLVMDYIEGETLEEYQARVGIPLDPASPTDEARYLPVEEVLEYGARLARVLGYLHERPSPVIFRDLKPANVMRTPQGDLYLVDFGIARHFTPGKSRDTMAMGSPGYAPPEQYGKTTSPRSDIYSLGATLHYLLTGLEPTSGATPFDKVSLDRVAHLAGLPILAGLDALLQEMVDTDAGKRPDNMGVVERRLRALAGLQGASVHQGASAPGSRAAQQCGMHAGKRAATPQSGQALPSPVPGGGSGLPAGHQSPATAFPHLWSVCTLASPADAPLSQELREHLRLLSTSFVPLQILGGGVAVDAAHTGSIGWAVRQANLIVLLLSPAFLGSPECTSLAEQAMRRHETGEALVIPLLAEPCPYQGAPCAALRPVPDDDRPISQDADRDEAWQVVRLRTRKRMVEFLTGGETSGKMSLWHWVLHMLFGYSYERRFRTANFGLKCAFPNERTGAIEIECASSEGWMLGAYTVRSHTDLRLAQLAQALGSADGRPEDILGDAY